MPEGPEVKIITDWLSKNFEGKFILSDKPIEWDSKSRYSKKTLCGLDLLGGCNSIYIENILCKGKQIFFKLNVDNKKIYLNSFLGMEGKWVLENNSLINTKHNNLWINFIDNNKLYFNDSRHFGFMSILSEDKYEKKICSIGKDFLSENISLEDFGSFFKNTKISNKEIGNFLLSPKYISTIGNYLRSEILYRSFIKPNRSLGSLSKNEIEKLYYVCIDTIKESYKNGGLTIRSYYRPDGQTGNFRPLVYGKKIDPNGYKIIKEKFSDGRMTHWVPEIQK